MNGSIFKYEKAILVGSHAISEYCEHFPSLVDSSVRHNILCLSLVSTFAATSACDWSTGTQ